MNAAVRLALAGLGLVVAFFAAFAVGSAVPAVTGDAASDTHGNPGDAHGGSPVGEAELPGLAIATSGYRLVPRTTVLPSGDAVSFSFVVEGPDGTPVRKYVPDHERDLHLIVVSRDLSGYQHVHPSMEADGTWRVDLDLTQPGTYRAIADFRPRGRSEGLALGTDLFVAGAQQPIGLPAPSREVTVDGLTVRVTGEAVAGTTAELAFTVTRDGEPVRTLQPYLGAYGHLVSLRGGDLAYLHTHPVDEAVDGRDGGPVVEFGADFPTAGAYRLFLDFQVDGVVRTAQFTIEVPPGGSSAAGAHDEDGASE